MNCDLPSVMRQVENPEFFFQNQEPGSIVIFDEIHRLNNPSQILKIGADEHPHIKILATGSSTLAATNKFRDSLTGRKTQIYLPPILWNECISYFNINNLDKRLLHGGLPEFLLSAEKDLSLFSEWIDSYYARDIQELFNVRNRTGFLNLFRLLLLQSGGVIEVSNLAKLSKLSRPTVMSHLEALSIAHAIHIVSPFFGGGKKEIVKRPKVYAFDTGFVTYTLGWNEIRETDRGLLWEHLVLDMLHANYEEILYWTEKDKSEIDFVIKGKNSLVHTVECKINPDKFSPKSLLKFRKLYPKGRNFCISPHINNPFKLKFQQLEVEFLSTAPTL